MDLSATAKLVKTQNAVLICYAPDTADLHFCEELLALL